MTREEVYAVVRDIPRGRVASYGDVARAAGFPNHARQVGYALSALPAGSDVPWQRVINAKGEVSPRPNAARQRELLEAEGVEFSASGRVDWRRFGWE